MSDFQAEAIKKIEGQRDELVAERSHLNELRMELLSRLRLVERRLADLKAAARAFELDVEFPPDDREEFETRRQLAERTLQGGVTERTLRSWGTHFAGGDHMPRAALVPRAMPQPDPAVTAEANRQDAPIAPPSNPPAVLAPRPSVREAALQMLEAAGAAGLKAADVREALERKYSMVLHDKTVGMTLYRLSKADLVHRDGFIWFFGPPSADPKNPGGDAPGLGVFG